jgi:hypothetical protein
MAHIDTTFPQSLAFGAVGGPMFSTHIVGAQGGEEQRNQNWANPLWRWEVGLVHKTRAETSELLTFFRSVSGMRHTFNFVNVWPGQDDEVKVVRFGVDHLDITRVDVDIFSWPSCPILEMRVRL